MTNELILRIPINSDLFDQMRKSEVLKDEFGFSFNLAEAGLITVVLHGDEEISNGDNLNSTPALIISFIDPVKAKIQG